MRLFEAFRGELSDEAGVDDADFTKLLGVGGLPPTVDHSLHTCGHVLAQSWINYALCSPVSATYSRDRGRQEQDTAAMSSGDTWAYRYADDTHPIPPITRVVSAEVACDDDDDAV